MSSGYPSIRKTKGCQVGGKGGLLLPRDGKRKVERTLSIYKLAPVFQANFCWEVILKESNRTTVVLLSHSGIRFCFPLSAPVQLRGAKFSFQRLFNLGILKFLPTLVQETPYPAQSNCEGASK